MRRGLVALARGATVLVYVTVAGSCLLDHHVPRVFWTILMPTIPIVVVLGGLHMW